ncbi:5555_t:CDS:1 [Funneliformis geosporum]|uniref:16415_t:CDS:1 n=1 Tax=Funneliformis geosporum TaxID=1117311 RepID=A0A9W4SBH4_9GLOM|nr:16415_t:CDS:1 [Funneliformis geosporum]CAI2174595.1 5555_t:CDS:1 [Funneliformis geosporum]
MADMTAKTVNSEIQKYVRYESDYSWFLDNDCETHGTSCPPPNTNSHIETVYCYLEKNMNMVDGFINNYFSSFDEDLKNKLRSLVYTLFVEGGKKDISISYEHGGSIVGTLIQVIGCSINENTFHAALGIVRYTKTASSDHCFSPGYWKANESRIENALQYMFYKDVIKRI